MIPQDSQRSRHAEALRGLRVLISGASVAGPVLAYWLQRYGAVVTVVERTSEVRIGGGGHAVDLFGPAVDLMEWMGVLAEVQAARTRTRVISLVRAHGRPIEVSAEALGEGVSERHIEIMRGDLARIVYQLTRDQVEYTFDDSIAAATDDGSGVDVVFERRRAGRYDLVLGADGLHSITRRLVFGPERDFLHFLGGYLAVYTVSNHLGLRDRMMSFSAAGRTAAVYPVADGSQARVVLLWRSRSLHDYDRHDLDAQRRLIRNLYGDLGWELPRLIAELDGADDLYIDSISQVVMDHWTNGRVALVGDAGYSPGPAVGGGTSLAAIGAYILASELASSHDPAQGLAAYERALQPVVRHSRSIGPAVMRLIIPSFASQIWLTAQAMRALAHLPTPLRRQLTSFGGGPAAMLQEARLRPPE
jgi:2-polyprenyl-6-methoxyphenol hydroxylase-like FAD-dependent oxidoreductase